MYYIYVAKFHMSGVEMLLISEYRGTLNILRIIIIMYIFSYCGGEYCLTHIEFNDLFYLVFRFTSKKLNVLITRSYKIVGFCTDVEARWAYHKISFNYVYRRRSFQCSLFSYENVDCVQIRGKYTEFYGAWRYSVYRVCYDRAECYTSADMKGLSQLKQPFLHNSIS